MSELVAIEAINGSKPQPVTIDHADELAPQKTSDTIHFNSIYRSEGAKEAASIDFSANRNEGVFVFKPAEVETNAIVDIGDSLQASVGSLRGEYEVMREGLRDRVFGDSEVTSLNDLIEVQYELTEVGLFFDLAVKMAQKTTQTVDTLLRGQ
jgi:hypothetical protein